MSGGRDLLIVGVAAKSLEFLAEKAELETSFGERYYNMEHALLGAESYHDDLQALEKDPLLASPRLFYLEGEHCFGSQFGEALGYVLFTGNNARLPRQLPEASFARIPELKEKFITELRSQGYKIDPSLVGLYAVNVYDT